MYVEWSGNVIIFFVVVYMKVVVVMWEEEILDYVMEVVLCKDYWFVSSEVMVEFFVVKVFWVFSNCY